MVAIKNVAGEIAPTPMGKGEKREASSPLLPQEPQYEKRSRDDNGSMEPVETIIGGDTEDEQHENALGGSPVRTSSQSLCTQMIFYK